jgi:hypothetical protein
MVGNDALPVDLEPACQSGPIECEGVITIENPAFVFDLPLNEVVAGFKQQLQEQGADRSWENDYDGFEVFHLKAENAIRKVVDHTHPRVSECSSPGIVIENIGPDAERHYDSWEDVAEAWVREWIRMYNSILKARTEEDIDQLQVEIEEAGRNNLLTTEDVKAVTEQLTSA